MAILANERWTTRPAHQIISSRKEIAFRTSRVCYSLHMLTDLHLKLRFVPFRQVFSRSNEGSTWANFASWQHRHSMFSGDFQWRSNALWTRISSCKDSSYHRQPRWLSSVVSGFRGDVLCVGQKINYFSFSRPFLHRQTPPNPPNRRNSPFWATETAKDKHRGDIIFNPKCFYLTGDSHSLPVVSIPRNNSHPCNLAVLCGFYVTTRWDVHCFN